ncbi:MAG: penicillin-binding protein 2 [Opitutaceae bacterium]
MSKGYASNYRIVLLATGLFVCFGALGARLFWLHVVDRDDLLKTIARARQNLIRETARRGDIRDARGGILATSSSLLKVGVDPFALRATDENKWPELAKLLELRESELRRIFLKQYREEVASPGAAPASPSPAAFTVNLNLPLSVPATANSSAPAGEEDETVLEAGANETAPKKIRWAVLRRDVSEKTYAEIDKLRVKGVYAERYYHRSYPNNQLAAHLLGFVNREGDATSGIEAEADFYLRGQDGWRVGERDGRGGELPQFLTRQIPAAHGYSVTLSIDLIVQDIVEQELALIAERYEPLKASIIVSDPRTGFILGLANTPTFNLNQYYKVPKDEMERMKNAAVADIYEPGSVFKIVPVAAGLEERVIKPDTIFNCALDKVMHRGALRSLPAEDHYMGDLTVSEIISHSSNKGAAQIGVLLGEERLYQYARAFGFGGKLGFPVGGEVPGILHPYRKWSAVDITRIPMGHTVSSTVLQMHQAMCVIAADGVLLRPQLISEIRDASNDTVFRYDRAVISRAVSVQTARTVATMLMGVARVGGTAPEAAIEGYDVAGKTGTTQKLIDGKYSSRHHIASFVGFFPALKPQIAISVVVDDADHRAPNGIAYGAKIAAPSFKRIGERLISVRNIQPAVPPAPAPAVIAANTSAEGHR